MFNIREYLFSNKKILFLFFIVGSLKNIISFLISISIGEFFTIYFHSNGAKSKLLKTFGISFHDLHSFFLTFAMMLIIKAVFEFFERWICFIQGELLAKDLREKVFALQIEMNNERFKEKYFGKYLLRYSNDMKAIQNYYTKGIMQGVRDVIFIIMGFMLLSIINFKLDICYILISVLVLFTTFLYSKRQKPLISESRSKRSGLLSFVAKSFQRHRIIKEKYSESENIKKFTEKSIEVYDKNMLNNLFESKLQSLLSFAQYLVIMVILIFMTLTSFIEIHSANALVFVLIMLLLNSPMKRILKIPSILNKGNISFQKMNELFEVKNETVHSN